MASKTQVPIISALAEEEPGSKTTPGITPLSLCWALNDGIFHVFSYLAIHGDDDQSAQKYCRCSFFSIFPSPGTSPLTVTVFFDHLNLAFTGSVENECGYSYFNLTAAVVPVGHIGALRVDGGYFESDILCTERSLGGYKDSEADDHSWHKGGLYPGMTLTYRYPGKGTIKAGDMMWMSVGLHMWHDMLADDVTASSTVLYMGKLDKIEVAAS